MYNHWVIKSIQCPVLQCVTFFPPQARQLVMEEALEQQLLTVSIDLLPPIIFSRVNLPCLSIVSKELSCKGNLHCIAFFSFTG